MVLYGIGDSVKGKWLYERVEETFSIGRSPRGQSRPPKVKAGWKKVRGRRGRFCAL